MDALQALTSRVSATGLTEPAPDEETLQKILLAATRAADHGRLKPWRFIVIRGGQREAFGQVLAESLKRRRPDSDAGMLKMEAGKPLRAPLIIVVAAQLAEGTKIPEIEQLLAVGAAAQNSLPLSRKASARCGAPATRPTIPTSRRSSACRRRIRSSATSISARRPARSPRRPIPTSPQSCRNGRARLNPLPLNIVMPDKGTAVRLAESGL